LLALLAVGCGPVRATSVISDAEAAVDRARAAGGEKFAPYETVSAELYLVKAREQQGRAQYGAAEDLAKQSLRFAREALERAGEGRSRQGASPAPASPATVTRSRSADQSGLPARDQ
jgi:Domain of unknown function (DUF4398)